MERKGVPYDYNLNRTLSVLSNPGLLLASTNGEAQSNVMTIGWGTVGIIWGKPIFTVLVRPSRYTYQFIEDSGTFTVNVPPEELRKWVGICGSKSGRDMDKFAEYDISVTKGQTVSSVTIDPCPMVYECEVVHYNDVIPANLSPEIEVGSYGGSDYHRLYYGQIMGTYAADSF